jgi:hypothetical protein
VPLAFAGAGLATVTLSACYGPSCVTTIKLPDGGTETNRDSFACATIDCGLKPDGGIPSDVECQRFYPSKDAGTVDAGKSDSGIP